MLEERAMNDSAKVVVTAQRAMEGFAHGNATGEWKPYLDMLTEDFTFWIPGGKFQGKNVGKERAEAFCYHISVEQHAKLNFFPPYRVTSHENTIVFEFEDEGSIMNQPVKNRLAFSFDVRDEKVCACREYIGIADPFAK